MDIRKIDALELLKTLDDKSIDLILTDPPYYKLLNISWDKQWKTKDEYLNWLEEIIKECQRVLKDNGSFYMFASAEMSWYVEGVIRKYFKVLNHIRWRDKASWSLRNNREELRRYINNSEEIIFAEQFNTENAYNGEVNNIRSNIFEPLRKYLDEARKKAGLTYKDVNKLLGSAITGGGMATHYFGIHTCGQWTLPTEKHYNKLKEHMELKPYEDILKQYEELKKEYEELNKEYQTLRRTFNLKVDIPYNNTWNFKQTKTKKGRHPCEKPEELISHIINVSSNENDLVLDMFAGSCSVPKCCEKLNRRCIAGDLDDTYF